MEFKNIDIILTPQYKEISHDFSNIVQYSTNNKLRVSFSTNYKPDKLLLILNIAGESLPAKPIVLTQHLNELTETYFYIYELTQYDTQRFAENLTFSIYGYDENNNQLGVYSINIPMEKAAFSKVTPANLNQDNSTLALVGKSNDLQDQINEIIADDGGLISEKIEEHNEDIEAHEFLINKIENDISIHNEENTSHENRFKNYYTKTQTDNKYTTALVTDGKINAHNLSDTAHSDIREKITTDINAHNLSDNTHNDIRTELNKVKAVAEGRFNAISFLNSQQLALWLDNHFNREDGFLPSQLVIGQNIYTEKNDDVDYWVSKIPVGNISDLSILPTDKVDLSDYYKKSQADSKINELSADLIDEHNTDLTAHDNIFSNYDTKDEVNNKIIINAGLYDELKFTGVYDNNEIEFTLVDNEIIFRDNTFYKIYLNLTGPTLLNNNCKIKIYDKNGKICYLNTLNKKGVEIVTVGDLKTIQVTDSNNEFNWEFNARYTSTEKIFYIDNVINETNSALTGGELYDKVKDGKLIPGNIVFCVSDYIKDGIAYYEGRNYLITGDVSEGKLILGTEDLTGGGQGFVELIFTDDDERWSEDVDENGKYILTIPMIEKKPLAAFKIEDGIKRQVVVQLDYSDTDIFILSETKFTGRVIACSQIFDSETIGKIYSNNTASLDVPTTGESLNEDIQLHQISKTGSWNSLNNIPLVSTFNDVPTDLNIVSEKLVYDSLAGKENTLPVAPDENPEDYYFGYDENKQKVIKKITMSGGGGSSLANIYFSNEDSDINDYKKLNYEFEPSETEFTKTANNAEKLIKEFLYDDPIKTTSINAGTWFFQMNCKVDNSANMTRFRFEPFLYHSDGTETDIFTENVFSPDINNTNYEYVPTNYIFQTVETDPTDRFGIRIYMRTSRPNPTALYFKTGNGFASYMTMPLALRHSQLREKNEEELYQHITLEEKNRLATIPSDANENLIESISLNNTALTISAAKDVDLSSKFVELTRAQSVKGKKIFEDDFTIGTSTTSADLDIKGDLKIAGDIIQQGSTYETHAEQLYTTTDEIILRDKATTGLSVGEKAGLLFKKYDGTNDGELKVDKDGIVRVGDVGSTQPLATREESPTNTGWARWNSTGNRFETSLPTTLSGFGITDGVTLTGIETLTNKTMTDPVIGRIKNGSYYLSVPNLTKNETIALVGDIPSVSGFVDTTTTQTIGGLKTFSKDLTLSKKLLSGTTQILYNADSSFTGSLFLGDGGTLLSHTTGSNGYYNTGIGLKALLKNTSGAYNTAVGYWALYDNSTGSFNTTIGSYSLSNNTTGKSNVAIGDHTLSNNTTGQSNVAIGSGSLQYNKTGYSNIAIGNAVGNYVKGGASENKTGSNSIFLGANIRPNADNETNQIVIGHCAEGNGSNTVTIGNSSITDNYFTGNIHLTGSIKDATNTFTLPNTSGTIALAGDIPSLTNYVTKTQHDLKLDKKPDGTNDLLSNNKLNTFYIPDTILGQVLYGGSFNATTAEATLSANAKTKLGTTSNTIILTNNNTAITGYSSNEGIFYLVKTAGTFANESFNIGDWLISTGVEWEKIDNTDAVTGVKGNSESTYRIGDINITKENIGLGNAEETTNKVTSISSSSTDTQYPSAKCVYDIVGDIESLLEEV